MYVDLNQAIGLFFASPAALLVAVVLILGAVNFFVRCVQTIEAGTFDFAKLPQVLDTLILRKCGPLIALGVLAGLTFDITQIIVAVCYIGWAVACMASELAQLAGSWRTVPKRVVM
jgi:hypothetical protein